MKRLNVLLLVLCLQATLFLPLIAKVSVYTSGTSNGEDLSSAKGPKGLNKPVLTSSKGGSILSAAARSSFTKTKITHGNKVVSAGTAGDADLTHVNADSVFAGTATFTSNDGNPVDNFTIDIGLSGSLKCKTPDPNIPAFFSLSQMAVDVYADGTERFSGTATQDGSGLFTVSGDIASSDFKSSANRASIKKSFPINFGTLVDGQKLAFFFAGSTLVSYGADVPITYCSADFFSTDTFQAAKGQAGKISISAAKTVKVEFQNSTLSIESADTALLEEISSAQVLISLGAGAFTVSAADVADLDGDDIPDLILNADTPSNQAAMISAIQNSSNNSLFVFGTTSTGDAFYGVLNLN